MDTPVRNYIRNITAVCAAALVFSIAPLHADNAAPGNPGKGGQMGMDRNNMPGNDMHGQGNGNMQGSMGMMNDLNLTDAQRIALRNAMQQRRAMMDKVRALHEQLRSATESDKYDEKQVRDIVRKHNTDMENSIVTSSKAMHDFYSSLTPEQKTKMEQRRKQMHERILERMHDRSDDGMGMDMMGGPEDNEPDSTPPKH